ncbi:response regulator transcription factor [Bradyrhizobium sp. CB3481]|uniref:response regulator transcription factor n=1 Tax=Bradyrhizobium sp. CB3481 TaxID=3039158 RepID=UPI0024B1066D|nr:response regulator transcription factor [Bradyrhizobium sp. CB3481]WFU15370.1 response regulator transcription factor [Bradyrhizobium sp. CB3481]
MSSWASNEQVELVSLDPGEAHARLVDRSRCDMLIYSSGAASHLELFAEMQLFHTLRREAALVILSDDENPAMVIAAIRSGAQGYFSNSMPPDLALQALSFVLHGGTYFPPAAIMAGRPLGGRPSIESGSSDFIQESTSPELEPQDQPSRTGPEGVVYEPQGSLFDGKAPSIHHGDHSDGLRPAPEFTERQYAVLVCLCEGDPNKVIGRKLGMTETTVKVHVREIMRKLGVSNRTQVAIAARRGAVGTEGIALVPSDAPILIKSSLPQ